LEKSVLNKSVGELIITDKVEQSHELGFYTLYSTDII